VVVAGAVVVCVLLTGLALWLGHRSLTSGAPSSGVGDAFSAGFEVFDPARARGREDLDSKENEGEALPSPDPERDRVRVDLRTGRVHVRRPRPDGRDGRDGPATP
jgi:hypothetical protein